MLLEKQNSHSPSFDFEMLRVTLLSTLIAFAIAIQPEHINVPVTFKRIGKFATGLSYGHLRATIDFAQMKKAHHELDQLLRQEILTASSHEKKGFYEMLLHQFSLSTKIIDRLDATFFTESRRQKRQLLPGAAMGFGILSFGLSIYNTFEISKLHSKVGHLESGINHMILALEEQDHAITRLTENVNALKAVVKIMMSDLQSVANELNGIKKVIIVSNMITTHNADVSVWGRGLEALILGELHPTLVDTHKLNSAITSLRFRASQFGLSPLFTDNTAVFKAPVTYLATNEKKIYVYVHIPFVDMDPIDLYEHLPIPFELGNLFVTLESGRNVIASDDTGTFGLELTHDDLLHCHVEKVHSGNIYVCPNSNILVNHIRQTCLGSLLFGETEATSLHCDHNVKQASQVKDFVVQIGPETVLTYSHTNKSVWETCQNGTKTFRSISKFTTLTQSPGCKLLSDSFIIKPEQNIAIEANIFDHPMVFKTTHLIKNATIQNLERAMSELDKIRQPEQRHLHELKQWLDNESSERNETLVHYGISIGSIMISGLILFVLMYLFYRYKSGNKN